MRAVLSPERPPKADRYIYVALLLLLFWMPMPWGSHRPWASALIGLVAFALLAAWLTLAGLGRVRVPGTTRLWWPLLAWLAWIGWLVLSIVPLDAATLAHFAPGSVAAHAALRALPGAAPLDTASIAPGTTLDGLVLTLGYFALYWLAVLTCCHSDRRMRWVLGTLVAAGLFEALYGSLMMLSHLEWGFFEPKRYYRGVATGTFVNRNHLAGYLELATAAGIGLILADLDPDGRRRSWRARLRWVVDQLFSSKMRVRIALAIMVVAVVLTRSRMGNVALFASMAVCGIAFTLVRERAIAGRAAILFLSILLVDVLIVSRWFGLEALVQRLERTEVQTEERVEILQYMPALIERHAPAGAGLGSFAVAFEPMRPDNLTGYYDHAHNDYAEFAVETGFIGGGLLLLLAGMHYLHALRVIVRRNSRTPAGVCFAAIMGLTALALHSIADFNLQIPANAGTLVVLMALAAGCSATSRSKIIPDPSADAAEQPPSPMVDTLPGRRSTQSLERSS